VSPEVLSALVAWRTLAALDRNAGALLLAHPHLDRLLRCVELKPLDHSRLADAEDRRIEFPIFRFVAPGQVLQSGTSPADTFS
jgi:hypothetical protein